jgi:hypothetical protein
MTSLHHAASVQEHRIAALAALALLCAACSKAPAPAPHPVEVATVIVHPQPTSFPEDFVAETEAINAVEIRPRVGGELVRRVPNEGERVKAGELLFVIDREPYIAALAQAKAGLAQSEAALVQSQRDLERAESLSETRRRQPAGARRCGGQEQGQPGLDRSRQGRGQGSRAEPRLHHHRQSDRRCRGPRAAAPGRHGHRQQHAADHGVRDRPHVREFQHQRTAHADVAARPRARAQPGCDHAAAVPAVPGRRLALSADSQAQLHRPGGRHAYRHAGDTARGGQPAAAAARRPVRARAGVAAAGSECDRAAAARDPGPAGPELRLDRRCRRQGAAARGAYGPAHRRRLAGAAGAQGRRGGDRRRRAAPQARNSGQGHAAGGTRAGDGADHTAGPAAQRRCRSA